MRIASVFVLGGIAAVSAHASIFEFNYPDSYSSGSISQGGGTTTVNSVTSTYDTVTHQLTFEAHETDSAAQRADFFSLALSPGANPNGHTGQMAMLYFDASKSGSPILTAYGYNGTSSDTTWAGAPDKISSTANGSLNGTTSVSRSGDNVTFRFSIDATQIDSHTPLYPNPTAPWTGVQYGNEVGIWFHSRTNAQTTYANGFLSGLSYGNLQWLDGANLSTHPVPEPAPMAAMAIGGAALLRRKKK